MKCAIGQSGVYVVRAGLWRLVCVFEHVPVHVWMHSCGGYASTHMYVGVLCCLVCFQCQCTFSLDNWTRAGGCVHVLQRAELWSTCAYAHVLPGLNVHAHCVRACAWSVCYSVHAGLRACASLPEHVFVSSAGCMPRSILSAVAHLPICVAAKHLPNCVHLPICVAAKPCYAAMPPRITWLVA